MRRREAGLGAIVQTAVWQLGRVLGTSRAAIRLGTKAKLGSRPSKPRRVRAKG